MCLACYTVLHTKTWILVMVPGCMVYRETVQQKLLSFLLCWPLVNLPSCCSWVQKYIFGLFLWRMFACIQSFSDSLETCCYFWWEALTADKTEQLQLTTHRLHFVFLRSRRWSIVPKATENWHAVTVNTQVPRLWDLNLQKTHRILSISFNSRPLGKKLCVIFS